MKTSDLVGFLAIGLGIFGYMNSTSGFESKPPKTEIDSIVIQHAPKGSSNDLELLAACLRASSNAIAVDAKGRNIYKTPSDMQGVLLRALEISYPAGFDFKVKYPNLAENVQAWIEKNLENVTDRTTLVSKLRELADAYEAAAIYQGGVW